MCPEGARERWLSRSSLAISTLGQISCAPSGHNHHYEMFPGRLSLAGPGLISEAPLGRRQEIAQLLNAQAKGCRRSSFACASGFNGVRTTDNPQNSRDRSRRFSRSGRNVSVDLTNGPRELTFGKQEPKQRAVRGRLPPSVPMPGLRPLRATEATMTEVDSPMACDRTGRRLGQTP